jgi:glycerol-3-phosphate cytidylyltransferase
MIPSNSNQILTIRVCMKKILTYGTYDLLHYGHIRLLQRAKALGDYLVVALSTDEFNLEKGKVSHQPYEERKAYLLELRCVDQIIPETQWEQKVPDVQTYGIHTFVMGDDWQGKFDFLLPYCQVVYLPRTPGISSTAIKALHR